MEKKQVLILIGSGASALQIQELKNKFGVQATLVTPEEAKEQGLLPDDFANIPSMKIIQPPPFEVLKLHKPEKSGREKRRERRKKERRNKY